MGQKFDKPFATNNLCMESTPFVLRQYLSSPDLLEYSVCKFIYLHPTSLLIMCKYSTFPLNTSVRSNRFISSFHFMNIYSYFMLI